MINTDMRDYDYYQYEQANEYGQPTLSKDIKGSVRMAVYITSQSVQDNINYTGASYIGLTHDTKVNDTYVIQLNDKRVKVLYVQDLGRYRQVYMAVV